MKNILSLGACLLALSLPACSQSERDLRAKEAFNLARDGKSCADIVLASDAIPAEKTAADQLQKYLQQVTGAVFPIKEESEVRDNAPQILVGAGPRVKLLLARQNWSSLRHDGIVIKTVGNKLILAGGRPRGALYAIYQFLEDEVGCRWWTATETTMPHKITLSVPQQNLVYVPPLDYREHFSTQILDKPAFATIMRENGHFQSQTPEWGGHYNVLGWCHTFSQLIPPAKYFKEHPAWFSDPLNSYLPCTAASKVPDSGETQLCLSNPEVVEELSKNALAWIAKNPEAGYISISQNDAPVAFCRCPACVKVAQEEGSISGPLVKFVNEVAKNVEKQYPDFLVETLAYQATEKPPKTVRPAHNVTIRFAPIEADFGHPLNSDWNRETRDNLVGWSKLSSRLFAWNYITNFETHWLPHPNWSGLGSDIRFFAANKVTGLFEQGDTYTNGVGDFVQLRAWLMSKLMWNPNLSQEKLTDEFLQGYYGNAAPFLKRYLNLVQESFLGQNRRLGQTNADFSFLTLDVMNRSTRLFDEAEAAVKNDKQLRDRVQRERLLLDIAWIYRYRKLKPESEREKKEFLGPPDPLRALQQFVQTAERFGEHKSGALQTAVPRLEAMFTPQAKLPEFARNLPAEDVIDFQQTNFYLYRKGDLSNLIDDENASDGKAASLVGDVADWAVQAPLNWVFEGAAKTKWHVYAYVRVATKAGADLNGTGVTCGIYDSADRKSIEEVVPPLTQIAGDKYQLVDLGIHDLSAQTYVWFAPTRNPIVEKIYIDRVLLIRER